MRRRLLLIVMSLMPVLALTAGCLSSAGSSTSKPSQDILRKSTIGTDWQMYQLRLILPSGTSFPVLLKLADGDKVEGYFYLEKGTSVNFGINADSPVYHATANASGNVTSGRFSFTASRENGSTYVLQFSSAANATEQQVVFLEAVYPVKGSIFVPLELK